MQNVLKYAELTEAVRQNDKPFIDMLNIVRDGNVDEDVKESLKKDLYATLMKTTIKKMPCTCMQKTNQLLAEMKWFLIICLVSFTL